MSKDSISIADPELSEAAMDRVRSVMASGMIADGPEVRDFESAFAAYCGTEHAVATANGTAALQAALKAAGIGPDDTVLTTPFSFVASANAARLCGADVIFADIDPMTYNLDAAATRRRLAAHKGSVAAIIAVHLYGLPAEMGALRAIADAHDAVLIEDAAQAHGATYNDTRVGSLGDLACFSFYPTKNMTTAEGGMVTTDDDALAEGARQFVNHGRTDSYEHATVGHNLRLTSLAAAIGHEQLQRLPAFNERRRHNAARLSEGLAETTFETPTEPAHCRHVYHQYTIRTSDREAVAAYLDDHDIGNAVYYPTCIHDQPAYEAYDGVYPIAERAAEEVLSLPVHPNVSDANLERIIEVLTQYDNEHN
jgi:dTDP-4-amino-4,6-dideoxygalactose transaminase